MKNFFDELEFPIFEFLLYFHGWKSNKSNDFVYNSLETEDNHLISLRNKGGWYIYSQWELFRCNRPILKNEFINEVDLIW